MRLTFDAVTEKDVEKLAAWLPNQRWPFHDREQVDEETLPSVGRLGGYTRHDNLAMRRVFQKCGYLQEAYHRRAWRVAGIPAADAVGYAVLRQEHESRRA